MRPEFGAGPAGPAKEKLCLPLTRTPPSPLEPEYMRVPPFLKLSGWSKSRLYRVNQQHLLLIKVGNATFVVLRAWREFMATCPRVGRAR